MVGFDDGPEGGFAGPEGVFDDNEDGFVQVLASVLPGQQAQAPQQEKQSKVERSKVMWSTHSKNSNVFFNAPCGLNLQITLVAL
jgi:hypothetical protein